MSDELKKFYREIWAWIQDGCTDHDVFKKHYGLCHNLRYWSLANEELIIEQENYLLLKYGSAMVPFNKDVEEYLHENKYQNPKRLAFIEGQEK